MPGRTPTPPESSSGWNPSRLPVDALVPGSDGQWSHEERNHRHQQDTGGFPRPDHLPSPRSEPRRRRTIARRPGHAGSVGRSVDSDRRPRPDPRDVIDPRRCTASPHPTRRTAASVVQGGRSPRRVRRSGEPARRSYRSTTRSAGTTSKGNGSATENDSAARAVPICLYCPSMRSHAVIDGSSASTIQ